MQRIYTYEYLRDTLATLDPSSKEYKDLKRKFNKLLKKDKRKLGV